MPPKSENPAERSVASSEIHKQLEHEIRMEIEFFLSKEGLQQNETLSNAYKESKTGSIPIETLLGLERLKSLGVTRDVLLNACADSAAVEINGDGTGIKRKASKSIEEFEPEILKKRKTENGSSPARTDDKNPDIKLFKITLASGDPKLKDSALRSEIERALGTEISYTRLKGREGYFSLDQSQLSEDVKAKLAHAEVEIFGVTAKIQECWDEDLDTFYKKHGKHMDSFLERTGRRRKLRASKDEVDLVFYNKQYPNVAPLEYLFEGIMSKTKNDEVINPSDHQLLRELITYHDNFDEIVKDLKYFTVGPHPTDLVARSFYAVKNDDTRVPFTFSECFETLLDCFVEARKDIEVKQ